MMTHGGEQPEGPLRPAGRALKADRIDTWSRCGVGGGGAGTGSQYNACPAGPPTPLQAGCQSKKPTWHVRGKQGGANARTETRADNKRACTRTHMQMHVSAQIHKAGHTAVLPSHLPPPHPHPHTCTHKPRPARRGGGTRRAAPTAAATRWPWAATAGWPAPRGTWGRWRRCRWRCGACQSTSSWPSWPPTSASRWAAVLHGKISHPAMGSVSPMPRRARLPGLAGSRLQPAGEAWWKSCFLLNPSTCEADFAWDIIARETIA